MIEKVKFDPLTTRDGSLETRHVIGIGKWPLHETAVAAQDLASWKASQPFERIVHVNQRAVGQRRVADDHCDRRQLKPDLHRITDIQAASVGIDRRLDIKRRFERVKRGGGERLAVQNGNVLTKHC